MQVKQLLRLVKSRRQLISWLTAIDRTPGIRHQFSLLVVNRNHDAPVHGTFAAEIADTERLRSLCRNAALLQIGVLMINALELEFQGLVCIRVRAHSPTLCLVPAWPSPVLPQAPQTIR